VPEVIGRFTSGETTSESTDPATQARNCSLGSLGESTSPNSPPC
jgi:hypothetical protein